MTAAIPAAASVSSHAPSGWLMAMPPSRALR